MIADTINPLALFDLTPVVVSSTSKPKDFGILGSSIEPSGHSAVHYYIRVNDHLHCWGGVPPT